MILDGWSALERREYYYLGKLSIVIFFDSFLL